MEDGDKKEKKTLSFSELITRASAADSSQKFPISANYYFIILSRHYDTLAKNKSQFEEIIKKFIFSTILLPSSALKERMLGYAIQNDNLNIFKYKTLLEKMLNYQLVYIDDIKAIMPNCPESHKQFDYAKCVFEHDVIALSKVFDNLRFDSAEKFLKMKIEDILNYTFKMSAEKKINATIDEKRKLIFFEKEAENMLGFDKQIQTFCLKAKMLSEYIKATTN